jgi:hypothetical protein
MKSGVGTLAALDGTNSLPPGTVTLQQSSAFADGAQFPFLQQSAAAWLSVELAKQSSGRTNKMTAKTLIAM